MRRVFIVINALDGNFSLVKAYLVSSNAAMYVEDGTLWVVGVNSTSNDNVYTESTQHIQLGETDRGEIVVQEIYKYLQDMTAFDFIRLNILDSPHDVSFDLVCDDVFDGTL